MCIYVTNNTKVKENKEPIIAYKVFEVHNGKLVSPYMNHKPKRNHLNKTCSVTDFRLLFNLNIDKDPSNIGFHLFIKKEDAIELAKRNSFCFANTTVVTKCEIPKWSATVIGRDGEQRSCYMTNRYIIKHKLRTKI